MGSNELNNIVLFFINHPSYFLDVISSHYPFTKEQLLKYKDSLVWHNVSYNTTIDWSLEKIDLFKDYIDWVQFSPSVGVVQSSEFLKKYDDRIDWSSFTGNIRAFWTPELIEKLEDKLCFFYLSSSTNVQWSEMLISKYRDKWDFPEMSINESIPWTIPLFEKYLDESFFFYYGVHSNRSLITFDFVEKYSGFLNWRLVSSVPTLPWVEKDLLNYWGNKIDWSGVASNTFLFENDANFFRNNIDKWQPIESYVHNNFSNNYSFPWSIELMELYKSDIDWNGIAVNASIIWDEKLIDRFSNYIQWGGLSPCELLDEKGNEIASFGGFQLDLGLVGNQKINWSINFIQKYEQKLDFEVLATNSSTWEKAFKPFLDDKTIDLIFRII